MTTASINYQVTSLSDNSYVNQRIFGHQRKTLVKYLLNFFSIREIPSEKSIMNHGFSEGSAAPIYFNAVMNPVVANKWIAFDTITIPDFDGIKVNDRATLVEFIKTYPIIGEYLGKAKKDIKKYFPDSTLSAEIIRDPESEDASFFLYIETKKFVDDAMKLFDQFDSDFFSNSNVDATVFNVSLKFI